MARMINGILGGIQGRIGNIEGYRLNGQWIVRSRRKNEQQATVHEAVGNQASHDSVKPVFKCLYSIYKYGLPMDSGK